MANVRPKKALGQHFLTDLSVANRIATTVNIPYSEGLPLLEVGPGTGVLTRFLSEDSSRALKVVEIDKESVSYLRTEFPSLDVIEGDFLRMNLTTLFDGNPFILIGNYPYNISSQIFFRLLEDPDQIPICAGMLQREVAQRICSAPGSKVYGILSVLLQTWYDCEYLFTVDENVFNPPPKVKSGVIRLVRNSRTTLPCDPRLFRQIVKLSFGQRRKTLRNSLSSLIKRDSLTGDALLADNIMSLRPEQLSVEEFISLATRIEEIH